MKNIMCFIFMIMVISCFISCDENTSKSDDTPKYLQKAYTKKDLDKILRVGMSKDEVIKIFGEPIVNKSLGLLIYDFAPSKIIENEDGSFIVGFSVNMDNGKVIRWNVVIGEIRSYKDFPHLKSSHLEVKLEKNEKI